MTNVQLLLSMGVPSLIILAGMYNSNSRFERIERRLDGIGARLDRHDLERISWICIGCAGESEPGFCVLWEDFGNEVAERGFQCGHGSGLCRAE